MTVPRLRYQLTCTPVRLDHELEKEAGDKKVRRDILSYTDAGLVRPLRADKML